MVEHIEDMPAFMREIWRVRRPGALVRITRRISTTPNRTQARPTAGAPRFSRGTAFRLVIRPTSTGPKASGIRKRMLIFETPLVHRFADSRPVG